MLLAGNTIQESTNNTNDPTPATAASCSVSPSVGKAVTLAIMPTAPKPISFAPKAICIGLCGVNNVCVFIILALMMKSNAQGIILF